MTQRASISTWRRWRLDAATRDAVDAAIATRFVRHVRRRAPPPDAEGESAVSLLLSELDNASALSLLRSLLARSDAVRDFGLAVGRRAVILKVIDEGPDE